jgi:acetylornithine deacetylase/succinyl-diaminopimelate desuccinylase-like protein
MRINSLTILKQLIAIPSFVDNDSDNDESQIAKWIYQYIKKAGQPVKKQFINRRRFNVLAGNFINPKVLVVGHMDTVKPSKEWDTNPLNPTEKAGLIYGAGSSDMKAGLSVMLSTLIGIKPKSALFLFYCDEEYDFMGMKTFIKKLKSKIKPFLIISMDGENLQIGNACRGLIEMTITVRGKSGHSGNPDSGINAITKSVAAFVQLEQLLKSYKTPELGQSTINIASINGGSLVGQKNNTPLLSREGNVIPDYCQIVLEVRPSDPKLDITIIVNKVKELLKKQQLKLEKITIRHNLRSWITPKTQLDNFIKLSPNKVLADPMETGYLDIQLLWETFDKITSLSFGPAEPGVAHTANEFVRISSLQKAQAFLEKLLKNDIETW